MSDTRIRQSCECPEVFFIETDNGRQMVDIVAYARQGYDEWEDAILTIIHEKAKDTLRIPSQYVRPLVQKLFQIFFDHKFGPGKSPIEVIMQNGDVKVNWIGD